jgi:hypothetical protein
MLDQGLVAEITEMTAPFDEAAMAWKVAAHVRARMASTPGVAK